LEGIDYSKLLGLIDSFMAEEIFDHDYKDKPDQKEEFP
jgi:hypothetical protein